LLYEIRYSDSILNIIYLSIQNKRIVAIFIDETQIKIGSIEETWLWVAIEPSLHRKILGVYIIKIRFIQFYVKHIVYSDGGAWHPEAYVTLTLYIDFIQH
jgi:hypothetical protein